MVMPPTDGHMHNGNVRVQDGRHSGKISYGLVIGFRLSRISGEIISLSLLEFGGHQA